MSFAHAQNINVTDSNFNSAGRDIVYNNNPATDINRGSCHILGPETRTLNRYV